jgi:putative transposase
VEKKDTTTRRMVIQFKKLNAMTKPHAGYLPNMEQMVESLASCRFKSKMDMRSGFWQVSLSDRAKDLCSFCLPSGRILRPLCMPFGLQGAPGTFQELMEILIGKCKQDPKIREILKNGHLASFFDDTGAGTNTEEEHYQLLEKYFAVCDQSNVRIKLAKCEFMMLDMDYLGFNLGWGAWRPSPKKTEPLMSVKVTSLKELQRFLGSLNFYRRHIKNFTYSSAPLTDLLKKNTPWRWTNVEENCLNELKMKLKQVTAIGTPRGTGEIVLVTDASDVGGGAVIFQWQTLESEQLARLNQFKTTGINPDGTFKSDHPPDHYLVPLGNWNWKWSETRAKYHIWELEMLAGVLALAANYRIVAGKPIVWMTDNEALTKFLDQEPPVNKRQRRWYVYLSQFPLKIHHLAGAKNELADYMSRELVEHTIGCPLDHLAKEAFARMDAQLDLCLNQVLSLTQIMDFEPDMYQTSELAELWNQLTPHVSQRIDGWLYYRTDTKLYREMKALVPQSKLNSVLQKTHIAHNHPGTMRTVLCFLQNFACELNQAELVLRTKPLIESCATCLLNKPNRQSDRGELGSLPTPALANELLYMDFINMDAFNGFDYVLTVVDALTHFTQFYACTKNITGEGVIKLLIDRWFRCFGKPVAIHSDNDVRWRHDKGFYQTVLKSLNVQTHFGIPRRPQTNGVCENTNRQFLQNMRCLINQCKSHDWVMLLPYCNWMMNSQISPQTRLSPCEMFTGRPPWALDFVLEPCTNPAIDDWLKQQLAVQTQAADQLRKLHAKAEIVRNRYRTQATYSVGDYALVHNRRWPQRRFSKLAPQWQGPFKIINVAFNSIEVMASPSLGGPVIVSTADCKKWSTQIYDVPVIDIPDDIPDDVPTHDLAMGPDQDVDMEDPGEAPEGEYRVKRILDHRWRNGWRFLVWWENFPADQATWEPTKNFVSANGTVNQQWKDYCLANDLQKVLEKALGPP